MRSVALDLEHRVLDERDIPEPERTSPKGVLFRIDQVGVCGTDRDMVAFRMRRPAKDVPWIVMGHEALGQVVACGEEVQELRRGDWVVPMVRRGCRPPCPSCARRRPDLCLTYGYSERGLFGENGYFTEFAVDEESDLVRVPEALIDIAVLMEPMSVVEKAVSRALELRQTQENNALVLGLGPIGMLTAMALQLRGFQVSVFSLEADEHPRARLLKSQGIEYTHSLDRRADLIIEAAGSADLALQAIRLLAPCGVFVTLGAQRANGELSFIDLIVGNQTIVGSVNANRESFESGLRDLAAIERKTLSAMIRRFGFGDYRRTLTGSSSTEPKFVHVIAG